MLFSVIDVETTIELSITFGGNFVHIPTAEYIGGGTLVVKNVGGPHMGKFELDMLCATEGITEVKGYYVLDKGAFHIIAESNTYRFILCEGFIEKG